VGWESGAPRQRAKRYTTDNDMQILRSRVWTEDNHETSARNTIPTIYAPQQIIIVFAPSSDSATT
jgi:hypothetical protein